MKDFIKSLKKIPLPELIFTAAAFIFLLFGLFGVNWPLSVANKTFTRVVRDFDLLYREPVAYIAAVLAGLGFLALLVRSLIKRNSSPQQNQPGETARAAQTVEPTNPEPKGKKKFPFILVVHGFMLLLCFMLFKTVLFPVAFGFMLAACGIALLRHKDHPWKLVLVSSMILVLFLAPYFFRGQQVHMKIADVMDAWVPQQKVLAESGKAMSLNPATKVDNIINGIRISGFVNSGYNVITWLFMIFSPFTAFTLNVFIMAFTAFWGMWLLLRKHVLRDDRRSVPYRDWIITGSALCFSLLPFYPSGGLSIAGLPLLLYCFLNVRSREKSKWNYIYIAFFPFYSVLPFAGLFIMIGLSVIFLIDFVRPGRVGESDTFKRWQFHTPYFIGLVILGGLYFFTHWHLIYSVLDPNFTSYREEMVIAPMSFAACLDGLIHNFIFDRSNIIMAQQVFLMLAVAVALILGFMRRIKETKLLLLLTSLVLFNAFLWGFKYWEGIYFLREAFPILNALNLARFFWLNPFLWYLLFAVALLVISKFEFGRIFVSFLLIGQLIFMFTHYNPEYRHLNGRGNPYAYSLSYGEYYSESLFDEVARFIGKPKNDYRVVSMGIPPGVAQYNGFYTLDVFSNVYPLEYKHKFRRIVEREMAKSDEVKNILDVNGKRCYLLSAEIHNKKRRWMTFARGISKHQQHVKIKNLDLNTHALKEMGGDYILSAVQILNHTRNGLSFERAFSDKKSPWLIYLYKVI